MRGLAIGSPVQSDGDVAHPRVEFKIAAVSKTSLDAEKYSSGRHPREALTHVQGIPDTARW